MAGSGVADTLASFSADFFFRIGMAKTAPTAMAPKSTIHGTSRQILAAPVGARVTGLPHSGQMVSGGSEILCRISLSALQAVQW